MNEAELIRDVFAARVRPRPDVRLGIGDDGAILVPPSGHDLVLATDALCAGTHFLPDAEAAAVGHRSLAVNLSDLAAMGAAPLWCTLVLSLPAVDEAWVRAFADGFFALADRFGIGLVGGDTVRGPLAATVTVVGRVAAGQGVSRRGARPGDGVYVTGNPGDAVAGRTRAGTAIGPAADYLRRRFLYPEPRMAAGLGLAGLASAMLDVSDGLHDDLGKLAAASGVGLELDPARLPLSAELRALAGADAVECALTGGDDYELCCTIPARNQPRISALAAPWPHPFTRIGTVVSGSGVRWRTDAGFLDVPDSTFRHF